MGVWLDDCRISNFFQCDSTMLIPLWSHSLHTHNALWAWSFYKTLWSMVVVNVLFQLFISLSHTKKVQTERTTSNNLDKPINFLSRLHSPGSLALEVGFSAHRRPAAVKLTVCQSVMSLTCPFPDLFVLCCLLSPLLIAFSIQINSKSILLLLLGVE